MKSKTAGFVIGVLLATVGTAHAANAPIYNDNANARQLIALAIQRASKTHKNVVLDFGANWCLDCYVLDHQMRQGKLARVVQKNYIVVHVSVGIYDRNLDLARKYGVPLRKGIPALAVLDSHGKLLYAQKDGQFENARAMNTASFLAFFEKWAPSR